MRARRTGVPALLALALAAAILSPGARAAEPGSLQELREAAGGRLVTRTAPETGALGWLRARGGRTLWRDDPSLPPERRALAFLARFGGLVGMSPGERQAPERVLVPARAYRDLAGGIHVRLDQRYRGLEVFGAQLVVHMDARGIRGVNGHFVPGVDVGTAPAVDAAVAEAAALDALAPAPLRVVGTRLGVYRVGLVEGVRGRTALAWAVELEGAGERHQVWVDAALGRVLRTVPLVHQAKYRIVYSPQYDPEHPDLFVQRKEGDPPSPLPPVNNLYEFTGQVYDLFWNAVRFDSYDGHGATMRTVYLVNNACPNAYWDGQATNYCPAFDADDVVGHEWGHAYTDFTHNLIYLCQPGALNESYSDIWGETLDLINGMDGLGGSNNDQPFPAGQRWLIGEDVLPHDRVHRLLLRDMWDPERLGYPARVGSANYVCGREDNGGVHSNSSVPNHAFAMLVDGKTFRGQTVRGIGLTRAFHLYWQAAAAYQTPASKFVDHAFALLASCEDLKGVDLPDLRTGAPSGQSIADDDCRQVRSTILATELTRQPTQCGFQPILAKRPPAVCAGALTVFSEDFEGGLGAWTLGSEGVFPPFWPGYRWTARDGLPGGRGGSAAFAVDPPGGGCRPPVRNNVSGHFTLDSPEIEVPSGGKLHLRFDHYVETQWARDGGNVKVSVNGGDFRLLPQAAYLYNGPPEPLQALTDVSTSPNTNPLAGQPAWSGTDGGEVTGSWGTTVVDLSSVARPGDRMRIRFDFGIDCGGGLTGWFVDNVLVYACPAEPAGGSARP